MFLYGVNPLQIGKKKPLAPPTLRNDPIPFWVKLTGSRHWLGWGENIHTVTEVSKLSSIHWKETRVTGG